MKDIVVRVEAPGLSREACSILEDFFKDFIKEMRLGFQAQANALINEAEEELVRKAIVELRELMPELPDAIVEKYARKVYWAGWNYAKEKFDADWIVDT